MGRAVEFPMEQSGDGASWAETRFEALAVPPRHELVATVSGWIFHNGELVLVRQRAMGWQVPGGVRRQGETFRETLERVAWEQAGVLLSDARILGWLRRVNHYSSNVSISTTTPGEYSLWFLAEARDLAPFSDEFEADDRMVIEPGLIRSIIKPWTPLRNEMLVYAQAARLVSQVRAEA